MPLLKSDYNPPWIFKNGHFSTVYSAKLRTIQPLLQERERISLPDGDFIDIDWSFSEKPKHKAAILLHGLEGNAQRNYMKGAAATLIKNGWDAAAVNYRGCSGELNRLFLSYNAGKTDDLEAVIDFILKKDSYTEIALIGFSLGGNIVIKYLGERSSVPSQVKKGIAISTPLNLKKSLKELSKHENWIYRKTFLSYLKKKYKAKMLQYPDKMTQEKLEKITSIVAFDSIYTAPAHGFKDADDYYLKNSCLQFLPTIKIPVFILNAKNDSFLSPDCYPYTFSENSKNIYLETPTYGGHVGFYQTNEEYYSEKRMIEFLNEY